MPGTKRKRVAPGPPDAGPVSKRPKRGVAKKQEKTPLKFDLEWDSIGEVTSKGLRPLLQLVGPSVPGSDKIAGFDLDYNIICPKSGRKWPTGPKDWMFLLDVVPTKIKEAYNDGFKIIIFTNQRGMEKDHTNPNDFMAKIEDIITALDIPIQVYAATGENHYRKPGSSMWDHMVKNHNDGVSVNLEESYYVGDAAGRAKEWAPGKKRDFSCSDRMFAANSGIKFYTPEQYFEDGEEIPFEWRSIDPKDVLVTGKQAELEKSYHMESKDLIVLVGAPAAGKSSFYRRFLASHNYEWVNRDTMKTPAKCLDASKKAIAEGKNVAVDNTNPSAAAREPYITWAKKKGYSVRCFILDTPFEVCHHLNMFRQCQSLGKQRRVPNVGFNVYRKNYQEPTMQEGFSDIKHIPFYPVFKNKNEEKLFLQWTD